MLPQADRSQSHFKSSGLTSSDEMQNMHKKKNASENHYKFF